MYKSVVLVALIGLAAVNACSSRPSGGGGCGGGGGCRHKARGVLQLEGDSAIEEDFGEIYGLRMWESPKPPANVTLQQAQSPSFLFKSCCAERGLPSACQARCNFDTYNQDLIGKMVIGADECPLDSLPEMHFCAAQGRDHTGCCRRKGVTEAEAGDKCLVFCDQIPDKFTHIDYTYASCFGKFNEMKTCFHDTVAAKAKSFFRHH